MKTLGTLDIGQWLPKSSAYRGLTLFEGSNASGGSEIHARLDAKKGEAVQLGPLSQQFPDAPIQTLMFEVENQRFIVGVVDASVAGDLTTIEFERVEPNSADWMKALKVSNINERTFVIPIAESEFEQWSQLYRIAVNSRESRQRGVASGPDASHEWQQAYAPPLEIGGQFTSIK